MNKLIRRLLVFMLLTTLQSYVSCRFSTKFRSIYSGTEFKEAPQNFDDTDSSFPANGPIRIFSFWTRAVHIYGSYKTHQALIRFQTLRSKIIGQSVEDNNNIIASSWEKIHTQNSARMVNLCFSLRGFYLKGGQFLGTRHDFMPKQYIERLSKLHDDVPPLGEKQIKKILEKEMNAKVEENFESLNLTAPIGSASIAQVHKGIWKPTGEKVAVKIQYPRAERIMKGDLKNLRILAEFLQRTELKFDILSAVKELQKGIGQEFSFLLEANNMNYIHDIMKKHLSRVDIPVSRYASRNILVMTFVEGKNLCRLAEFREEQLKNGKLPTVPLYIRRKVGKNLLKTLAKAWGIMIFKCQFFNSDPHPGNICLQLNKRRVGLLDWGQMKRIEDDIIVKFAELIIALDSNKKSEIIKKFQNLGVVTNNEKDYDSIAQLAQTMFDTKRVPGVSMDPFSSNNVLKKNGVKTMPSDVYFLLRTVQLMRGISSSFEVNYSLASEWTPFAKETVDKINKKKLSPK